MIEWREGAVFYGSGRQHESRKSKVFGCELVSFCKSSYYNIKTAIKCEDFQLNEPREGYYIPKSELDTGEKYNRAVGVFGLFGFKFETCASDLFGVMREHDMLTCCNDGLWQTSDSVSLCKVKLTFDQLMAIGELKRKMNERDAIQKAGDVVKKARESLGKPVVIAADALGGLSKVTNSSRPTKKRKSKEAYRILESMGVEWDNVEGKWFKVSKEWL